MSKMSQVIQIGEIEGKIHYYIEDYAYTFLKKQETNNGKKYFLYGEKEETKDKTKLYIYGIGQKPKMEQTYFKEYYPLGFLKVKEDGKYWISLSGQENLITGVYVFYAPNQAMQEYLVDYHKEEKKEEKIVENVKKRFPTEMLPMKETVIPSRKLKDGKRKRRKEELTVFPAGGVLIAFLILIILTSTNGKNKINLFKQVIKETMSNSVGIIAEEDFVIEEKKIGQTEIQPIENQEMMEERTVNVNEESKEEMNVLEESTPEDTVSERLEETKELQIVEDVSTDKIIEEPEYEEYTVQNGDTLVAICKKKYNSLFKMEEICRINNIKNADYIAPGQKLYLPR